MGIINFPAFVIASTLFIISPGLDTIFILNKSIAQGRKAGLYATLGVTTGALLHTMLAAFGLSVILAQSAIAFSVVKFAGAAYLIVLGVIKLLNNESIVNNAAAVTPIGTMKKSYLSAVLTNVLNPKVPIFFLAFFPQFIQAEYIHTATPYLVLGLTNAVIALIWFTVLTYFAGTFSHKLRSNPAIGVWLNKFSAVAFILMGFKMAFIKR